MGANDNDDDDSVMMKEDDKEEEEEKKEEDGSDEDDVDDGGGGDDDDDDELSNSEETSSSSPALSDSGSDSDDMDESLLDDIMDLEKKVEESDGRDYHSFAKLLIKLAQAKLKERLELARREYEKKFLLSEEQFLHWLRDKTNELENYATSNNNSNNRNRKKIESLETQIEELFVKATKALPASVNIWLQYLSFSVMKTFAEDTEEERRGFYEKCSKIVAKDFNSGDQFWIAYRAFECAQTESVLKRSRVQNVSKRALETPLAKLDDLKEKILVAVNDSDRVMYTKSYEIGIQRRELRKAFEEQVNETAGNVVKSDPRANVRAYRSYIAKEKMWQKKDQSSSSCTDAIEALYERALLKNPYEVCLWVEYAKEVEENTKNATFSFSVEDILNRAFRACPSSVELLIHKIELSSYASDEKEEAFVNILQTSSSLKSFKTANDVALAFLHSCKFADNENEDTFLNTIHRKLLEHFPNKIVIDAEMRLARYWAQRRTIDPETVWNHFLVENEKVYGDYLEAHLQRAKFFEIGNPAQANLAYEFAYSKRNKLTRAVKTKAKDESKDLIISDLCNAWRSFLETSPESFRSSYSTVKSELQSIAVEKACAPPISGEDLKRMRREGQLVKKRKEQEDSEPFDDKNKRTKLSLYDRSHPPRSEKPRLEVIKELYPDRDKKTCFIKNLDFSVTEEELENFFGADKEGTVKARVIKDRHTGRSKGIAYVDFSNEATLVQAIMRDGEELKGRAMSIARSRPPANITTVSSGGGRGNFGSRGGRSTELGFVPRAVKQQKKQVLGL
jgi:squamous cell carcinoma antigen recognized by T-cells 3